MKEKSRPIHSAMYHRVPYSVFINDEYTCQVSYIYDNEIKSEENKIQNEERLKGKILPLIIQRYNSRIESHNLTLDKLSSDTNLAIKQFIVSHNSDDQTSAARFTIFPKEFICKKCGKVVQLNKDNIDKFSLKCSCGGEFEQNTIVTFCEKCGKISPLDFHCKTHFYENIVLKRPIKNSIKTWSVQCKSCPDSEPIDIFRLYCNHTDYGKKISNEDVCKRVPLTVRDGGVYTPINVKTIDFPKINLNAKNQNYLILAIDSGKITLDALNEFLPVKFNSTDDTFDSILRVLGLRGTLAEQLYSDAIKYIESVLDDISCEYSGCDVESICDLWYLNHSSKSLSFDYFISSKSNVDEIENLQSMYSDIKKLYKVSNVVYLENINLVSTTYGVIKGYTKSSDDSYIPHFEPFWNDIKDKSKGVYAISYPFTTEGILFELDPVEIIQWLYDNEKIDFCPNEKNKCVEYLHNLNASKGEYSMSYTLLHTLSHKLIKLSSIYTGLDENSYGEMIFVNNHSFLIYSTSTTNIGGLGFIFKHNLYNWFSTLKYEMSECTFDPSCSTQDGGACFNCLYLPEHVCSDFNNNLSRHAFIGGSELFKVGFWDLNGTI